MTPARSAALSGRARSETGDHSLMTWVRSAVKPLVRGSTYRTGVFLLLGAVVLLPYVLLGAVFAQMLTGEVPRLPVVVLLALTGLIASAPAFLRPTRALEIHAVRWLLDVDLPDPPTATPTQLRSLESAWIDWQSRFATATWYGLHLLAGGLLAALLFFVMPLTVFYGLVRLGVTSADLGGELDVGPFNGIGLGWLGVLAVGVCAGIVYLVAGLRVGLARLAPVLLGPSAAERMTTLEATAADLARRNRLARELHDSVGHALTVTTLQAAAARTVLDRDPTFVRNALLAIEDAGRAAMADLDHVLGLLRVADDDAESPTPQQTLAQLHRLVADSAAAGRSVTVEIDGAVESVPAGVSREGYRIVQESLTNAMRHGSGTTAAVRVAVTATALRVEVHNPAAPAGPSADGPGGRGLVGMAERVHLQRGTFTAGWADGMWTVQATLPFDPPQARP